MTPQNLRFQTDNPHFQVSLLAEPPHLDIPDDFRGGTAFLVSSGNISTETLMAIPHHLPYTPEVQAYLYAVSYNGSTTDPKAGLYSADNLVLSGSAGTIADVLYIEVDNQNLYIKHSTENFFAPDYTSDADKYMIRLKYYIFSNNSHVASYNTRGY